MAIELRGVTRAFEGLAFRDLSLVVPEGVIYALVGPGASGKSLVLKMMAGLLAPDAGRVVVRGRALEGPSSLVTAEARRDIGMLFQNNALFDHLSVGDNVAFPLRRLLAPDEAEARRRVDERLAAVALDGFYDRATPSLSGGQKKRVGLARATVTRAPILLFDEPTAGLDPVTSRKIYDLIERETRAEGRTAVVISSDLDGVLSIADRLGVMHRGELVFDGTVSQARDSDIPVVRQFVHGLEEGPL